MRVKNKSLLTSYIYYDTICKIMTPYVNTHAVSRHNSEAKTLDTTTYRIGKWRINLEGFIDYYGTYNYRFGVNGGTPTYSGEIYWSADTNGVGYRNHLKKADAFLDKMRTDRPLHGPPNINPYGYLIPLDGQPKGCIGTHVSDPGEFAMNREIAEENPDYPAWIFE